MRNGPPVRRGVPLAPSFYYLGWYWAVALTAGYLLAVWWYRWQSRRSDWPWVPRGPGRRVERSVNGRPRQLRGSGAALLRPRKFPESRQRAGLMASHQPAWGRSAWAVRLSEVCQ